MLTPDMSWPPWPFCCRPKFDEQSRHTDHLEVIEPGFTVNAEFMRMEKGELETLAEWPPIHVPAQEP